MPFANIAYAGDDYQDLAAIQAAGLGLTVADAHEDVQQAADWVSGKPGDREQFGIFVNTFWMLKVHLIA